MKCPSCNRENADDAKFCSGCGINFEEILKCQYCNAELASDDSFCYACGKPIDDSSDTPIGVKLANKIASQTWNCPDCNTAKGTKFGFESVRPDE